MYRSVTFGGYLGLVAYTSAVGVHYMLFVFMLTGDEKPVSGSA